MDHISMITLGVQDLERATSFYRDGLGLKTRGDFPGVTFFDLRGAWLSLYPLNDLAKDAKVQPGTGWSGVTLAHNVKTKEEVDALIAKAQAAGAQITDAPHDREWGGHSGYFRDPDGYVWEVAWNPHFDLT